MTSKLFPAADAGTFHRYPPANAGTFHLHLLSPSHPFIGTVVGSPQFAWTLQVFVSLLCRDRATQHDRAIQHGCSQTRAGINTRSAILQFMRARLTRIFQ